MLITADTFPGRQNILDLKSVIPCVGGDGVKLCICFIFSIYLFILSLFSNPDFVVR